MIAPGEVAGSSSAGRLLSAGLGYKKGAIDAGVGYIVTGCQEAAGCPANKGDDKVAAVGAAYNFGASKLGVIYTRQKNAKNVRGNDANVVDVNFNVPINAWEFTAGYQHLNDKSALNQDVTQYNFTTLYWLSKRTTLYGIFSKQKVDNGGKAGFFSILSSNDKLHQLSLGLRHRF
jgi:GBP family porin